jgi:histidine triad (HIT) family protein
MVPPVVGPGDADEDIAAAYPKQMCIFCSIAAGGEDAAVVFEDELCMAFLDVRPLFPGHTLLIPRAHVETVAELPDDLIAPFFKNIRLLARAIEAGMAAEGSFIAMNNRVSQSVPHLHAHIVPRRRKDGLRGFFWPRSKYRDRNEMDEVASRIADAIRDASVA